jgi:hypothetical protein
LFFDDSLRDGKEIDVGRLAWCFTGRQDWEEVFRTDLTDWPERFEFLLASHSALAATRSRLKRRALSLLSPDYPDFQRQINADNYRRDVSAGRQGGPPEPTYRALQRLLGRARACGTPICFVAFPTLVPGRDEPYPLPSQPLELIREAGMSFLDLRHLTELRPDMYATRAHLNEAGRLPFSQRLGQGLAPLLHATPRLAGGGE